MLRAVSLSGSAFVLSPVAQLAPSSRLSPASWILLTLLVVGGVLLVVGLLGRRRTDRPRCRRCGHDLRSFGDIPAACAGCGASLGGTRAVRFGPRESIPRMEVVGAGLLIAALIGGVLASSRGAGSPAGLAPPPPPAPSLSGRAALTFSKPADPLSQPELVSARVLPLRAGGAIEVMLATTAGPPRFGAVWLEVGSERLAGQVRAVAEAAVGGRSTLVVVIDFPAADVFDADRDAGDAEAAGSEDLRRRNAARSTRLLEAASRLELHVAAGDGTSATWGYREPFSRQSKEVEGEGAGP